MWLAANLWLSLLYVYNSWFFIDDKTNSQDGVGSIINSLLQETPSHFGAPSDFEVIQWFSRFLVIWCKRRKTLYIYSSVDWKVILWTSVYSSERLVRYSHTLWFSRYAYRKLRRTFDCDPLWRNYNHWTVKASYHYQFYMCYNSKTDASVTKLVIEYQNFISVFKTVQYCTSRLFRDSKQHSGHGTFHCFFWTA